MVTLTGGAGPDTLTGTASSDQLTGAGGDDSLIGAGGDDVLNAMATNSDRTATTRCWAAPAMTCWKAVRVPTAWMAAPGTTVS